MSKKKKNLTPQQKEQLVKTNKERANRQHEIHKQIKDMEEAAEIQFEAYIKRKEMLARLIDVDAPYQVLKTSLRGVLDNIERLEILDKGIDILKEKNYKLAAARLMDSIDNAHDEELTDRLINV